MDLREDGSSFLSAFIESRLCSTITVPRLRFERGEEVGDEWEELRGEWVEPLGEWAEPPEGDPLEGEKREVILFSVHL